MVKLLSLAFLIDRDTNYHVKESDPGSGFLMRGGDQEKGRPTRQHRETSISVGFSCHSFDPESGPIHSHL